MGAMKTEIVKLSQIQLNKSNPRTIRDEKFEKLVLSILVFPKMLTLRPIVVDDIYTALGGNMRFKALSHIATLPIDGIKQRLSASKDYQKKTKPEQEALLALWDKWLKNPIATIMRASELSVDEQKEFIIKDNVGYGEWDKEMLSKDWSKEDVTNWGLDIWDEEEEDKQNERTDIDEDEAPEVDEQKEAITKLGDIWQLGNHRLMCGDSTDTETVEKLMGGVMADLYLSDPPYNVAYEGKTEEALTIQNDSMSDNDFRTFLCNAFKAVDNVLKPGASFYIWHADSEGYNFRGACFETEWTVRQCLIWNKNCMVMGRQDYQWKHEPCLYGWKQGASHSWYSDRKQTTVIDFNKPQRNGEHPTMKPVGLMGYLIENSTKAEQVVLDTFGGSGTTLVACEQLDRICYTMELDPRYCDVIIKRWELLTEGKAVLVDKQK